MPPLETPERGEPSKPAHSATPRPVRLPFMARGGGDVDHGQIGMDWNEEVVRESPDSNLMMRGPGFPFPANTSTPNDGGLGEGASAQNRTGLTLTPEGKLFLYFNI